jgi:hypothetical protein
MTDWGSRKAMRLTLRKLNAERIMKPFDAAVVILTVLMMMFFDVGI